MSEDALQQDEEVEVLLSIYDGDGNFKQVNSKTYQYKYEEDRKSFILEVSWGPTYPTVKPTFNLDIPYNEHLLPSVKENILSIVDNEATIWLGSAMTYTIFQGLKEKAPEVLAKQTAVPAPPAPPAPSSSKSKKSVKTAAQVPQEAPKKPQKKKQLSKSQKRRAWDRGESGRGGEKPRGWDWVDIIKHLSQLPPHRSN